MARGGPQGRALSGAVCVADQPRRHAPLLAMLQEHGAGVVAAAIVDQHDLVGQMSGQGVVDFIHQMPDIAGFVFRRNQHRHQPVVPVVRFVSHAAQSLQEERRQLRIMFCKNSG